MTANLEYDLENPSDIISHKRAVFSFEMAYFIWNLKHNIIRRGIKDLTYAEFIELLNEEINDLPFDIDQLIN